MTQESESATPKTETTTATEETKDQSSQTEATSDDAPKAAEPAKAEKAEGAEKKDAKAESKSDDKPGKDEEPAELTFEYPDSFGEVTEENDKAFREFATKHGLSQDAVNDGLKLMGGVFGPAQSQAMHSKVVEEMAAELKKEHGKKYDERAGQVKALLKDAGGQELIDWMDQTGGSVAKPLFNALVKIAAKTSSDTGRTEPSKDTGQPKSRTILRYDHPTSRAAAG